MRKTLLLLTILSFCKINAQLTTETLNFNNWISEDNNDLTTNFVQPTPYGYELITDGSSGYFLKTSLQGAATQPLKLCSKFKGIDTETMLISIQYKVENYPTPISSVYNSVGLLIAKDNGETVLSARISNTTSNPYGKELSIFGLSNPNSTYNPPVSGSSFINGNWYKLTFEISKIDSNKFSVTSKIYDIGTDGLSTPTLKITNTKEGFNYYFKPENTMNIHIVGGYWGDVKYLDNFEVYGFKDGNNCGNLSTQDYISENKIVIYPNPFQNEILLNKEVSKINIYNLNGQLILTKSNVGNKVSVESLDSGIYMFEIFSDSGKEIKKLIKK